MARIADGSPAGRGWIADVGWLAAILLVALTIRIERPWSVVFLPAHVNLIETDAWYHVRAIENLVRQFPHRLQFDPYASPSGDRVPAAPFFDVVIAAASLIAGWGHPSPERVAVVAVLAPPVLGALTVVLVYGVARLAAGSLAGLLAAALAAILPGMFLGSTLLGSVDPRALEACVSVAVLYVIARLLCRSDSVIVAGRRIADAPGVTAAAAMVALAAMLVFRGTWEGQSRFGADLVPAIAIVVGCMSARLIQVGRQAGQWQGSAAVIAVAAVAFGLNVVPAISMTGRMTAIPAEWFPAFDWLRHESAEPFGDPDYYYGRYDVGPVRIAASSVMVWPDYGYQIMAAAHRVPTATPAPRGREDAGHFFMNTDEARARAALDAEHARYVFVDELLPFQTDATGRRMGKFEAIAASAGAPASRFYDSFLVPGGASYRAVFFYFPDYYRTMAFRLGVLGGRGVTPDRSDVVSWVLQPLPDGHTYRIVTALETFSTYQAAEARLAQLGPGNHAIVGQNPRISPVPLEPIRMLRLAYRTPAPGAFQQGAVQVFTTQ